jgi:predicted TIM-barrel fold metal-dependent hydrolase
MSKPIDVHCHVFNRDVLSYRILFSVIEALVYALVHKHNQNMSKVDLLTMYEEFTKIYNFVKTGMSGSSIEIYEKMEEDYIKTFREDFIAVPLTFDLYFCFKGSMKIKKQEKISQNELKEFSREMKLEVKELIKQLDDDKEKLSKVESVPELLPQEIIDFNRTKDDLKEMIEYFKGKLSDSVREIKDIKLVGSFKKQLLEVERLREKYPGKVLPFLAADPRRFNIVGMVKKNVSKAGPYYGVKVYTPNGYSPTDPDMLKIYEYCSAKNLPVTAHCSHVGFASFENTIKINGLINDPEKGLIELKKENYSFSIPFLGKDWVEERASVLNDPIIWEEVLERFPNLKLNLAHFGKWDKGNIWQEKIFNMMNKYPNLYTDLSCYAEIEVLDEFKERYWKRASDSVRKRIMYGSDYYLNLVFTDSFKEYLENFKKVFSPEEFNQISMINPRRFLDLDFLN